MTDEELKQVRQIVREEIERLHQPTHYKGIPLPPNAPVVQPDWRWSGGVPGATSMSSAARPDPNVMLWNSQ